MGFLPRHGDFVTGKSEAYPLTKGWQNGKMSAIKYRVDGKEYLNGNPREPGSPAESPGGGKSEKVRPGAKRA